MNIPIDITNTILNTKRLTIRAWRMTDAEDLYEYASVDGVGQMAGWTPHKNVEESMEIIRMFMDEKKTFALEYQGKVIGSVGIEEYAVNIAVMNPKIIYKFHFSLPRESLIS